MCAVTENAAKEIYDSTITEGDLLGVSTSES